jgi:hypothetical protein
LIRFRLHFNRQDFSDAGAGAPFIWEELLCVDGRPAKLTSGAAMAASASRALRLADELGRRPTDDELIVVVRPCFVGREDFVEAGLGVADFELRLSRFGKRSRRSPAQATGARLPSPRRQTARQ